MSEDTINLEDTIKIFKKNLKSFYFFVAIGLVIGLVGIFVNINYIEKKIVLSSKITIKNPLENYLVLDLFSLDTVQVDKEKVSVTSTQEKIKNYNILTMEYLEIVLGTLDLKKYDIDEEKYNYKIKSEKKESEYHLTISNLRNADKVEESLRIMVDDFNQLIKPIILKNILIETTFIENFLTLSDEFPSEKLNILIKIRKEAVNTFKDQDFIIFEISSYKKTQEISNFRIIVLSLLVSLSLFLMMIIIKK